MELSKLQVWFSTEDSALLHKTRLLEWKSCMGEL